MKRFIIFLIMLITFAAVIFVLGNKYFDPEFYGVFLQGALLSAILSFFVTMWILTGYELLKK